MARVEIVAEKPVPTEYVLRLSPDEARHLSILLSMVHERGAIDSIDITLRQALMENDSAFSTSFSAIRKASVLSTTRGGLATFIYVNP